jgi:ribosomal protein S18 acetylase RimI-like enzyme
VLARARAIAAAYPSHPAQLLFLYLASETPSIDYVLSRGGTRTGGTYRMVRDLALPIPQTDLPEMLVSRSWRMETGAEQTMYVAAHNACFPDAPPALGDWQHFLSSLAWATGTTFTAFAGSEIVGSVLVYSDEEASRARARTVGATERIFVVPAWQRRGVSRHLICHALAYLRAQGLDEAILEVFAANRSALRLYAGLGYRVVQESNLYALDIAG